MIFQSIRGGIKEGFNKVQNKFVQYIINNYLLLHYQIDIGK